MQTSRFVLACLLGVGICLAASPGAPAQVAPEAALQVYTVTGTVVRTYVVWGKWQGVLVELEGPLFIQGERHPSIDIDVSGRPLAGLLQRRITATGALEKRWAGKREPYWVLVAKEIQVLGGK